jgi:hypothetical protein
MGRIRVRRTARRRIHPHNDLIQGAHHFKTRIDARLAKGDLKGITYDILAELIFLAFAVEARINFLGIKVVPEWKERAHFEDKVRRVVERAGLCVDWNTRPWSTVRTLKKELRDVVAHAKPQYRTTDEIVVIEQDAADGKPGDGLQASWAEYCTGTFYREAYEDVQTIWEQLLPRCGLTPYDALTGSEWHLHFLGHVDD